MKRDIVFCYDYSAKVSQEVQDIRRKYLPQEPRSDLETLRQLDAEVKRPATVFAYGFGSIGAVVMGGGMSLVMTDIGTRLGVSDTMLIGVLIGLVGLLMASVTYPIYKRLLASRRKKYAERIMTISDTIMKG